MNLEYFGNNVYSYFVALAIIIVGYILGLVVKSFVKNRLNKQQETDSVKSAKYNHIRKFLIPLLYFGSFYLAVEYLTFPESVYKVIRSVFIIVSIWLIIRFIIAALGFFIDRYLEKSKKEGDKNKVRALTSLINVVIWVIGILFLLDNLGFNVATIIAGLGIGGIAIALAAQAILGDLFSYFVIFFDRPFEIGDFVVVDDKRGVIEEIGIKTTKIRSLSGEILVVSNSNLTNSRLHNFKLMKRRRVVFVIGVTYQTSLENLKVIPSIIKSIIEENENVTFDRSNFSAYNAYSLDFETVYFVESADYIEYMNTHEKVNLKIYEEFEKRGIEFAYPTQTLYMNQPKRVSNSLE